MSRANFSQIFSIKTAHTALIDDFRQIVHFLAMRSLLHVIHLKIIINAAVSEGELFFYQLS